MSFSEAQCPYCQVKFPYSMLKKASNAKLACPKCGGAVKNTMNSSPLGKLSLLIIIAIPASALFGVKVPSTMIGFAALIAISGLLLSAKNNKLVKAE